MAVAGVGRGCGWLFTGQARDGLTPMSERHCEVCTGAVKNVAGLTETVPVTGDELLVRPVSVPSSSVSSVCRSMSVKLLNIAEE
jgi:hypothetical protein